MMALERVLLSCSVKSDEGLDVKEVSGHTNRIVESALTFISGVGYRGELLLLFAGTSARLAARAFRRSPRTPRG